MVHGTLEGCTSEYVDGSRRLACEVTPDRVACRVESEGEMAAEIKFVLHVGAVNLIVAGVADVTGADSAPTLDRILCR